MAKAVPESEVDTAVADTPEVPVASTVAALVGSRDPLDIPFAESGLPKPVYYNPHKPNLKYFVSITDPETRELRGIFRGIVKDGLYFYSTPREEGFVRANISKHLKGNPPDRWMGTNLEEDDRWYCGDCQFTCLNTKVALDHRRVFGHTERKPV